MNLYEWAQRHGVPYAALRELQEGLGLINPPDPNAATHTEAWAQSVVRLEAASKGVHLWRNNVGAGYMQDGSFMRWGLLNDSAKLNERIKSADLVGARPVLITQDMVGQTFARLTVRECKAPGWNYSGTDHEAAQLRFLQLVLSIGGDAAFATGAGTL